MALRDVRDDEMITVLKGFLNEDPLRIELEGHARLAPFLEDFAYLLDGYRARVEAEAEAVRARAEVLRSRAVVEAELDSVTRRQWLTLQVALLGERPELVEAAERLIAAIFPDGRTFLKRSAFAKITAAHTAETRLSPKDRQRLAAIHSPESSLAELHRQRMVLARRLEHIEIQRRALPDTSTQASLVEWRRAWIRTMRLFKSTLDIVPLREEERAVLWGHVEALSELGRERRLRRRASDADAQGSSEEHASPPTPSLVLVRNEACESAYEAEPAAGWLASPSLSPVWTGSPGPYSACAHGAPPWDPG